MGPCRPISECCHFTDKLRHLFCGSGERGALAIQESGVDAVIRVPEIPDRTFPGKVTRIADFGAFVELEPGIEGLIHVSELSTQRVRRVRDIVSEGQMVNVEMIR